MLVSLSPLAVGLAQEHLHCMGVPQWPVNECVDPFPVFAHVLPKTYAKQMAGNVTRLRLGKCFIVEYR